MQGIPLFSTVNLLINHEQPDDYRTADDMAAIDDADPNGQTQKSASNVEPDIDENLIDGDLNSDNSEPETDDENGDGTAGQAASKKPAPKRKLLPNISKLDTCTIQVYPALNPEHEYFRLPVSYMNYLNVNYKQTQDGLIIYGIDTVHAYEQILREIIYFNRKPAYYLNRAFKLSCSELNGRFLSNDYIQVGKLLLLSPEFDQPLTDSCFRFVFPISDFQLSRLDAHRDPPESLHDRPVERGERQRTVEQQAATEFGQAARQ